MQPSTPPEQDLVKEKEKITPDYCVKISKRIRRNMLEVIRRKGGNFYRD